MRVQYLVDRELDVVSGGATAGGGDGPPPPPPPPVPTRIILETPGDHVVEFPFAIDSTAGMALLAYNPNVEAVV